MASDKPVGKSSVLEAARRIASRKAGAQQPAPKSRPQPIAKMAKGGAVERFFQKYPDFDPRA